MPNKIIRLKTVLTAPGFPAPPCIEKSRKTASRQVSISVHGTRCHEFAVDHWIANSVAYCEDRAE